MTEELKHSTPEWLSPE